MGSLPPWRESKSSDALTPGSVDTRAGDGTLEGVGGRHSSSREGGIGIALAVGQWASNICHRMIYERKRGKGGGLSVGKKRGQNTPFSKTPKMTPPKPTLSVYLTNTSRAWPLGAHPSHPYGPKVCPPDPHRMPHTLRVICIIGPLDGLGNTSLRRELTRPQFACQVVNALGVQTAPYQRWERGMGAWLQVVNGDLTHCTGRRGRGRADKSCALGNGHACKKRGLPISASVSALWVEVQTRLCR